MKKSLAKKTLIIVGAVIVLLVVIVIAIPLFVDVNKYKPTLETDLSTALGRKVEIGNIHLSILSGGMSMDEVSIADDPAFSTTPFLQAKQLTAGVAILPLIFSKKIEVSSFTVTDPQVSLLRSPSGKWNYSSLGSGAAKSQSESSNSAADISVAKLDISNGTIVVGTAGGRGKTHTYQDVNLEASDLSYTTQFPFKLTANTPGGGTIKLEGKAGPINSTDASLTPIDATIDVAGLDIAATGFVDPSSGLAGLVDFTGNVTSDGRQMNSQGTLKADKIKLVPAGAPSRVPVNIDYVTNLDLARQTGVLKKGDVHIGSALAALTGTYDMAGTVTTIQMKMTGQGMSAPDLEGVLPAVGVTLPSGASLKSGTLNVNLTLSGPVDRLTVVGPVNLSNGTMAGFSLSSKLGALGSFAGLGKGGGSDTVIQTFSANVRQDPTGTQANNVNLVIPSIGTITGVANVSSAGKLDCKMSAKMAGGIGSMTSGLSSLTGGGKSQSGGGIPFKITGTTSDPIFVPDIGGMATGMAGGMLKGGAGTATGAASGASSALGGLFGKKKN
jgi:AsmA protein